MTQQHEHQSTNTGSEAQRAPRRWNIPSAIVFVGFACMILVVSSCRDPVDEAAEPIRRVKVFVVGKKATGQSRRISGKIEAAHQSTLSFGVSGKVVEIIAEAGQTVARGQLLAQLDSQPLRLGLEKARSDLTAARAKLVEAQARFDRTTALFKEKGASQQEVDEATSLLATANGDLSTASGALERAELDFGRTKLTAPFSGKVADVPIDTFQDITANEPAVVLQAAGALTIELRVPETLIRQVDFGQVVQATFPSLEGLSVGGVVTKIGAEAEAGNAFPVSVRLSASDADLRPGMTASVTFNFSAYLGGRTAYLIPLSAIAIEAGLRGSTDAAANETPARPVPIFIYDPAAGRIRLETVVVGDLRGNELEVFEGLRPGDQVVSAGVAFLRDGMEAEVWRSRQGIQK